MNTGKVKLPTLPPARQGIVVEKSNNYIVILSGAEIYLAHKNDGNPMHYDVGHKVIFEPYQHDGKLAARIERLLSPKSYVEHILRALYDIRIEARYEIHILPTIALYRSLQDFCRAKNLEYIGITKKGFLFRCVN